LDHLPTETPEQAGHRLLHAAGYRAEGGKVTMPRVRKVVTRAIEGHEDAEHGGERKPVRVKAGGTVTGKAPQHRPDKRARRADGGKIDEDVHVDRRYEAEGIDQPHGPEHKRADGGSMPGGPKHHGKGGGPKTINVIVGKGDDGDQKAQMAHQVGMQQGMQQGMQLGKQAAGPGPGAPVMPPPRPPMAPPPGAGMPPSGGGGMAGGPPMVGEPRPPGMQMARDGGRIKVRAHERRKGGAV